jgi:Amt family ammonium transporter
VLCVGIFSSGDYGAGWNLTTKGAAASASGVTGVLYDFSLGLKQLASQAIGVAVIWTVILGIAYAFFKIQNAVTKGGIRSDEEDERTGLDLPEMGVLAYPEFGSAFEVGGNSPRSESVPSGSGVFTS